MATAPPAEWGLNPIEAALWSSGYQKQANNIHCIPGTLWTPKGAGLPHPHYNRDINVRDGQILIVRNDFHADNPRRGTGHYTQHIEVAFSSVQAMTDWLTVNGKLSEPGLPPFYNSWD